MTSERSTPVAQGRDYQLPALLAEIAEVAGLSAALAIAQLKGGTRVSFPATSCSDDHWLVASVGRESADRICKHFSADSIGFSALVPLGPTRLYDRARFEALALSDAGQPVSEIARAVGVSTRAVEIWRAAERKRKAVRRVNGLKADGNGQFKLARVYNPVQGGLMRNLSGDVATPRPDFLPAPPPASNRPELPVVELGALPTILADIALAAGLGASVVVGKIKHGKVLHITDHAGRGDELAGLVGPESADKLKAFFQAKHGGEIEILVPALPHDVFLDVATWCEAAREAGHMASAIADWLGITPAVVDHLCAAVDQSRPKKINFRASFPYFTAAEER